MIETLDQLQGEEGFTKKYYEYLDTARFSLAWKKFPWTKSKWIWLKHSDAFLVEHWGDTFYKSAEFE